MPSSGGSLSGRGYAPPFDCPARRHLLAKIVVGKRPSLLSPRIGRDWSIRDLKNRALSERIALLKELESVGDVNFDERQIKDRIRAIRDIRARQEQKAALVERNAHVASIQADLEESEAA